MYRSDVRRQVPSPMRVPRAKNMDWAPTGQDTREMRTQSLDLGKIPIGCARKGPPVHSETHITVVSCRIEPEIPTNRPETNTQRKSRHQLRDGASQAQSALAHPRCPLRKTRFLLSFHSRKAPFAAHSRTIKNAFCTKRIKHASSCRLPRALARPAEQQRRRFTH